MEHGSPFSAHNTQTKSSSNPLQVGSSSTNAEALQSPNNIGVRIEEQPQKMVVEDEDTCIPINKLLRIMRRALPPQGRISNDAKEAMQMCVNEFIGLITDEANEKCKKESRKTVTAEDIIWAMDWLGFDDYVQPLIDYLKRYRNNEIESLVPRED